MKIGGNPPIWVLHQTTKISGYLRQKLNVYIIVHAQFHFKYCIPYMIITKTYKAFIEKLQISFKDRHGDTALCAVVAINVLL